MRNLCTFALVAIIGSAAVAADVADVKVVALDGFGGDTSSVLARCQTKPGTVYDPVTATRDVNSLKVSGDYQDITVDAEKTEAGVVVTFGVFRKMRYQGPLVVKGNEEFSVSKIAGEAELKDRHARESEELKAGEPELAALLAAHLLGEGE